MARGAQCKKCGAALAVAAVPAAVPKPVANPYAPPSSSPGEVGLGPSAEGLWHDGKILVAAHDAAFPDRCIKCNAPAEDYRLTRKLRWHASSWYLLILVNLIVYAIAATIVQKKAEVHVGLCVRHRKRRHLLLGLGWAVPLMGIAGCSAAIENPNAFVFATIGILAGLVLLVVSSNVVSAEGIDERFVRIRGVSAEFLASLPSFHRH